MRWVRVRDITRAGLTADEVIERLAVAVAELGKMLPPALLLPGEVDLRFDRNGEPLVRLPEGNTT